MRENNCRKLYADTEVHTVGFGRNLKVLTDVFHPFASASSYRNDTFLTFIRILFADHTITIFENFQLLYRCVKIEIHMVFHCIIQIFKNNIIDICSEMTYGCIQKIQFILQTELLELSSCCRIELCSLSAIFHIDIVYIFHQFNGFVFSDMLVQCSAKIIGDIIFSIGECTCATKAAHNRTSLTVDTVFDFFAVNRTFSFFKRISLFKNSHFVIRFFFHQLVCRKDSSRAGTNNDHIIVHASSSL